MLLQVSHYVNGMCKVVISIIEDRILLFVMIIDGALLLDLLLREHVCTIISVLSRCEQLLTYIHVAATPNNFTTLLCIAFAT